MQNELPQNLCEHLAKEWDVVIVGAGPAGATAAAHLATGNRVLLLDKANFPRDKICGDGLFPDALRCLADLGIEDEVKKTGRAISTASAHSPSGARVDITGNFLTIKRRLLDAAIAKEAVAKGAVFCRGKVRCVEDTANGEGVKIWLSGVTSPFHARLCLLATGADITLAKQTGMINNPAPQAIALRCYVKSDFPLDRLILFYMADILPGYCWIFPLRDNWFNIGCGSIKSGKNPNLRDVFHKFTKTFPPAQKLMRYRTAEMSPLQGAMIRSGLAGSRQLQERNILLLGENAATTFPSTGEGVGKAMQSGVIAASVARKYLNLGQDCLDEYSRIIRSQFGPLFQKHERAGKWMANPWLNELIIRSARKSASLRRKIAGILEEKISPDEVFSFSAIVRSLFH